MSKLLWIIPVLFALAACTKGEDEEEDSAEAGMPHDPHGGEHTGMQMPPVESGPLLKYQAPQEWKSEQPKGSMRKAQYAVPDKDKKEQGAQFVYYGTAISGTVEDNVKRWNGQIGNPQGEPKVETFKAGDFAVTVFDGTGDYEGDMGIKMPNTRFLGAIVETPKDGRHFFRLNGPVGTVSGWRDAFVEMLKGVRLP